MIKRRELVGLVGISFIAGCSDTSSSDNPSEINQNTSSEGFTEILPQPDEFDDDYDIGIREFEDEHEDSIGRTFRYSGLDDRRPDFLSIIIMSFENRNEAESQLQTIQEDIISQYDNISDRKRYMQEFESLQEYQIFTKSDILLTTLLAQNKERLFVVTAEDTSSYDPDILLDLAIISNENLDAQA